MPTTLPLLWAWSFFLLGSPPHPTSKTSTFCPKKAQIRLASSAFPQKAQSQELLAPLSPRAQKLLAQIRAGLRHYAPRMKQMGFELDGSYCHIGAAFGAAYISRLGLHTQLFQPRTMHMLAYFDLEGRRFFVDQTMAQFFIKGSRAHKKLLQEGGFFGTQKDFVQFYTTYIDDVVAFGSYENGGYLPKEAAESDEIKDPYVLWEKDVEEMGLNSKKARIHRVLEVWYQGFSTDTSHDQNAGLFWTAKYYYNHFSIKVHVTKNFSPN